MQLVADDCDVGESHHRDNNNVIRHDHLGLGGIDTLEELPQRPYAIMQNDQRLKLGPVINYPISVGGGHPRTVMGR